MNTLLRTIVDGEGAIDNPVCAAVDGEGATKYMALVTVNREGSIDALNLAAVDGEGIVNENDYLDCLAPTLAKPVRRQR